MEDQPRDDLPQNDGARADETLSTQAGGHEPEARHDGASPAGAAAGGVPWMQGRGRWVAAGGLAVLLVSGVGAGAYAVGTAGGDGGGGSNQGDGDGGVTRGGEADRDRDGGDGEEELLVGDELAAVRDAVRAAYGGAIVMEAETETDGDLEAHIVTRDGEEITVELDEDLEITGTEEGR